MAGCELVRRHTPLTAFYSLLCKTFINICKFELFALLFTLYHIHYNQNHNKTNINQTG